MTPMTSTTTAMNPKVSADTLRKFIADDPISHERGASPDRVFRVDMIAAACEVSADTVRSWALGQSMPSDVNALIVDSIIQKG